MKKSLTITMTGMSLLLSILFALTYHSEADLIDETCKPTQFPDLCISTLRFNPSSAGANVKGLARIMLEAALAKATATLDKVKNFVKQTSDPALKECFNICNSEYETVVEAINKAIQNLGSDNFQARSHADTAIAASGTCEDVFTNGPNKFTSPLTDMNNVVQHLISTAEEIVDSLR